MSDKSTTPRPWRVVEYDDMLQITSDSGGRNVANIDWRTGIEPEDHDNAELICKAVNQYDHVAELVEAVKTLTMPAAMAKRYDEAVDAAADSGALRSLKSRQIELAQWYIKAYAATKEIRSALAKMEVQP